MATPYKTVQNFNSLRCLVLEISSFAHDDNCGVRAGAGVDKLFVGCLFDHIRANPLPWGAHTHTHTHYIYASQGLSV